MNTLKNIFAVAAVLIAIASASFAQTSLPSLDGGSVDVQAQKGKVVVLAVGATWLPLSAKQAQFTNAMVKNYGGKNVAFYFIATDSATAKSKNFASNEDIRKFAFTNKLSIPVLRDPDGTATLKKYSIDQVPSFVILDKNGVSIGEPYGGIDPKYDITIPLSRAIDKAL
jgi:thiol-disulfide isomerase/thioredoxin